MPLKKAGGNWVVGDRFFDREPELATLIERCHEGTHTLLSAQRRMGKTSLVRELLRRLDESRKFDTVFVDLEAAKDPADAIAEVWNESHRIQGFWPRAGQRMRQFGGSLRNGVESLAAADIQVKLRARVDAGNWRLRGERIWGALAQGEKPVVLALDEFPILISRLLKGHDFQATPGRKAATDEFLSWLRKMGQQHQGRVTLIVTGSVGLRPILRQAGLTAQANILVPLELEAWHDEVAKECLTSLAGSYGVTIPGALCSLICARLRCGVPHHVQQFFAYLHDHLRRAGRTLATPQDVEDVYSGTLLSVRGQLDLEHYENRLRTVLGPRNYTTSLELLTEAAVNNGWLLNQTLARYAQRQSEYPELDDVVYVLEHDGYFTSASRGYRFTSGLLEDWWRARHGQHFVSIHDR